MKRILVFLFCLLFLSSGAQQAWISKNAVWHYGYQNMGYSGFYKIEYEKDTLIFGRLCQALHERDYKYSITQQGNVYFMGIFDYGYHFTYQSGDTVFYLNNNKFYVLYNFAAKTGDMWYIGTDTIYNCTNSLVKVDSTGSVLINNQNLKVLYMSTPFNSSGAICSRIIERWGAYGTIFNNGTYLFPFFYSCNPNIPIDFPRFYFICYSDSAFPLYNKSPHDCEDFLNGIENYVSSDGIFITPNPANDMISISSFSVDLKIESLNIFDLQGRFLFKQEEIFEAIDVSRFSVGIYLLQVNTNRGSEFRKLVISR
jgi:hypothetical protein